MKDTVMMGPGIKRVIFAVLVAAGVLLSAATVAVAKGPSGVAKTVHNLSSANFDNFMYYSRNEDEICIFCHTPHGGSLTGPLWNRSNPVNSYQHYNSVTLSPDVGSASRLVNDESLLCLSCHDGSIAVNRVLNESNRTVGGSPNPSTPIVDFSGGDQEIWAPGFGVVGARIGASPSDDFATNDLTDDHPISFSFWDVYNNGSPQRKAGLVDPSAIALGGTVRLFGADAAGGLRVECSTCHDPHVNYDSTIPGGSDPTADESFRPFLYTSNTNSDMCLACHNK